MANIFKWLWFKLSKHYRIMYWGLFRDFSAGSGKSKFVLSLCSIYRDRNHLFSLCTGTCTHRKAYKRGFTGQQAQKVHTEHVNPRTEHAHAHRGRRWSVFSNGVCKQVQINQVWPYFHLETIFSNMSHILKNRFRCLELVQNSCKKCSVQMKKISLQCLLLSAFLTE